MNVCSIFKLFAHSGIKWTPLSNRGWLAFNMNLIYFCISSRLASLIGFPSVMWCNAYRPHIPIAALGQVAQALWTAKLHCLNVTGQYKWWPLRFKRRSDETMYLPWHHAHFSFSGCKVATTLLLITVGVVVACISDYEQWTDIPSLFPNWGSNVTRLFVTVEPFQTVFTGTTSGTKWIQ